MKTMPNWQQTLTVEISDCDATGRWKPSAMLIRMQEAAECHAAELGFPRQRLLEAGMCWVIYRQRMTLRRVPEFGEALRLCTWPAPVEGVLFPRHYRFETPAGAPLAEATSSWVLIDIHTRRPLRPTALPGSIPTDPEAERPLPGMLRLPADVQALETRRVRWSELDVNGHMNNARYADWLCDALDARRLRTRGLSAWQINYVSEALTDEEIALTAADLGDRFLLGGARAQDGRSVFQAEAVFGPAG